MGEFDALILAGGRSARLGGVPKSNLKYDGATLLERSLAAVVGARKGVVVGPEPGNLPSGVVAAREDPPFSGPAAAVAAGLAALRGDAGARAEWTLVLACDMPHAHHAVDALLGSLDSHVSDGVIAADANGRLQPLAAIYRTSSLELESQAAAARGELVNLPVFKLLARLDLLPVHVPG